MEGNATFTTYDGFRVCVTTGTWWFGGWTRERVCRGTIVVVHDLEGERRPLQGEVCAGRPWWAFWRPQPTQADHLEAVDREIRRLLALSRGRRHTDDEQQALAEAVCEVVGRDEG